MLCPFIFCIELLIVFWKRSPNDHNVDDNNLSDGELELGEAVISVNQYIMQPIIGHSDVTFPATGTSHSFNWILILIIMNNKITISLLIN